MTLGKHYGFGPDVVDNMTLAQQYLYIEGIANKGGQPAGRLTFDTIEEAAAYRQRRQALNG